MPFKDAQQRKFLFAMDKDKQKGIPVQKSAPTPISTTHPSQMTKPPQAFKLGAPAAPKFQPPVTTSISPTATPSLPALPKFAKTRKYLKKEF